MVKRVLFLGWLLFASYAQGAVLCQEFFAGSSTEENRDGTGDLIAYLGTLLEQRIIGENELARFIAGLEADELVNPISEEHGRINSAALLHHKEIQEYLEHADLNTQKLLAWAQHEQARGKNVKVMRQATAIKTEDIHQKMEFHPIRDPKFTYAFEMMSTKVTQKHWVELMGQNPSKFYGVTQTLVNSKGETIKLQPDHPVEQVTWWSVLAFANALSELHGLEKAYHFIGEFKGRAEDGTLEPTTGKLEEYENITHAEGYRLPTREEQDFLRDPYAHYYRDNPKALAAHAWCKSNSNGKTHAVAQRGPITFAGKNFYDLFGNAWEWGEGMVFVFENRSKRFIAGGGWDFSEVMMDSRQSYYVSPETREGNVGFRLVRTIK